MPQNIKKALQNSKVNLKKQIANDKELNYLFSLQTNHIKQINLSWNRITSADLYNFATPNWKSLEELSLFQNKIGDQGCKYISAASLPNLTTLFLSKNQIGSAGLFHLSKAQWKKLGQLNLSQNQIGNQGAKHMVKANWGSIHRHKYFYLCDNYLTAEQMLNFIFFQHKNTFIKPTNIRQKRANDHQDENRRIKLELILNKALQPQQKIVV